jgi:hypothetical protein
MMNMDTNNLNLDHLRPMITNKITTEEIYGHYQKPKTLVKLEQLVIEEKIDLETIGFFLSESLPYSSSPIDIIPFASTGGDGCYFAFLTDFGYYQDLENAPIVFISPSDFDEKFPYYGNKIFAKNIMHFIKLMTIMKSAEFIRFKNLFEIDFNTEIANVRAEIEAASSDDTNARRREVINLLSAKFEGSIDMKLEDYYMLLENKRKVHDYIHLRDGLGLQTHLKLEKPIADFSNAEKLNENLCDSDRLSKLIFYREAPYIFKHFKDDYIGIMKLISEHLGNDGFSREAHLIKLMIDQRLKEITRRMDQSESSPR